MLKVDLKEPDADPETIVRFKASQFDEVLVDDTSLVIEGSQIGHLIKWKMEELEQLVGRQAEFRCFLGFHRNQRIEIYLGIVRGKICQKSGGGFGFDPYFQPEGSEKSYGDYKPDHLNARYLAAQNFLLGKINKIAEPLPRWSGPYQAN